VTIGWIANSLELGAMKLSENLRAQIAANSNLEIVGEPEELRFDQNGNLPSLAVRSGAAHSD